MATKDQYEYFKGKYKEEDDRNALLTKRAEIYLSLVSLLFTGLVFKINDIKTLCDEEPTALLPFIGLMLLLLSTVYYTLGSIKVKDYESDFAFEDNMGELGWCNKEDSDFFDDRIKDFMAATKENFKINNIKGGRLKRAGNLMFCSFLLLIVFICWNLL